MSHKQKNIGLVLLTFGTILLFGNFGLFNLGNLFGAGILAAVGFLFSRKYYQDQKQIWALLVASPLFAAAAAILNPAMAGTTFLATLALGFIIVYKNNKHWWAIIPAGFFATIASVAAIEERFTIFSSSSELFFFFGLAATFSYLYFKLAKKWAIYPAISFVGIAILASSFSTSWLLPVALVSFGFYLLKTERLDISNLNSEISAKS